jgi:hypothetical protein
MMKLEAVELALQISYGLAVCHHLWVHAVLVLHDLIHNQLKVSPDLKVLDPEFDSDSETVVRASYSAPLFDARKCSRTRHSMRMPRGEMKTRPTPAPSFMTEPSKYMIHVSCSIDAGRV